MLFQIAKWTEFISAFAVLLPTFSIYYYLIIKVGKKQLQNDITIIAFYSIIAFYIQTIVLITSLNGIHNLWLFHSYIGIELFFFSYILLLYSRENYVYLALFLSILCFSLAKTFDDPSKLPYLSVLIQFFTVIIIAPGAIMNSIFSEQISKKCYYYKDYLIKAILVTTIGNFVFVSFLENYLILILFIHATLNIYSNFLFARTYKCYSETIL